MTDIIDFIYTSRDRYVAELIPLLRIPSISAVPAHAGDVTACAEALVAEMSRIGLENVRIIPTAGHPLVYGDWLHADGAPTILLYGHYDVQPAEPLDQWETPPFEPSIREGNLYARGAADDKGQVFAHLKAIEAHLQKGGRLPVNMKVILEGEEETGSEHFGPYVREHAAELAADMVLISDTEMFERGVPSICYGLRGLCYMQIDVRGSKTDLHSGSFGGAVANPANVLAHILASLKDKSGNIKIPGFYDTVRELREDERAEFKRLPFDEVGYRRMIGAPRLAGEKDYSVLERVWCRPSLDVNGILSGWTGDGAKTVIPATAMAKVSMRLVPNQDPTQIAALFETFVRKLAPKSVEVTVTALHGAMPWMTEFDNPYVQAAGRAIEKGFGKRPVFTRDGASIPVVADFQAALNIPVVLFGLGLPDDNLHAPNEKLTLDQLFNGVLAAAFLYDEVARTR